MKTVIIKTQADLDALTSSPSGNTIIEIRSDSSTWIQVTKDLDSRHVEAWGSSHVEAWGSSHVVARDSSHVVARDSSHVEARDSSHVEACDSSHVEAWGSSHVEAWGSSHVVARGSSHVVAWGSSAVHVHSLLSVVELFGFAIAFLIAVGKCKKRGKTATIVRPKIVSGAKGWLAREGVADSVLFKRVSGDFRTQENTANETFWMVGSTVIHPNWQPKKQECGPGKFYGCSRPYFCDQFRSRVGDRYVAIRVAGKDMRAWPSACYQHKIGFRKGVVLYECDRYGNNIRSA